MIEYPNVNFLKPTTSWQHMQTTKDDDTDGAMRCVASRRLSAPFQYSKYNLICTMSVERDACLFTVIQYNIQVNPFL